MQPWRLSARGSLPRFAGHCPRSDCRLLLRSQPILVRPGLLPSPFHSAPPPLAILSTKSIARNGLLPVSLSRAASPGSGPSRSRGPRRFPAGNVDSLCTHLQAWLGPSSAPRLLLRPDSCPRPSPGLASILNELSADTWKVIGTFPALPQAGPQGELFPTL